jgi:hypothetical protein
MNKADLIRSLQRDRLARVELRQKITSSDSQVNTQTSMPSMTQMIGNLTSSIVNNVASVASGNPLTSSDEEAKRRLSICNGCEFFNSQQQRCGKCGCKMAVKTYLRAEKCPVGKW